MLVFRHLEHSIKAIYREKKQETNPDNLALLDKKLARLLEISEYVKRGNWLGKKTAKERLLYCLNHSIEESAEHFNCTKDSISSSLTGYSRKFEKLIGANTIKLIMEDKVDEGMFQFYMGTGKLSDLSCLLVSEVSDTLPDPAYSDIDLKDCATELKFLRVSSLAYFASLKNKIDLDKLAFIRYIIESNDESYLKERGALFNFLNNEKGDLNTLLTELNSE